MMLPSRRIAPSLIFSVLLHASLALLLWYVARDVVQTAPAPVAVELWTSAPLAPAVVAVSPRPVPPAPAEAAPVEPDTPKADIQLGHKPALNKRESSQPKKAEAKPLEKKPAEKKPLPDVKQPPAKKQPDAALQPDKPGKGKRLAKHYSDDTNDLLADLNSSNTSRPANSRSDRAGAATGSVGGVAGGSAQARDNYAAKIEARIRPLVQVPPDIKGNPRAVVQVQLLPTLEVRAVKLLQSSGNAAYDEAVQRAIWEARTFPTLPAGLAFSEVRQITLKFRPKS